MSFTVSSTELSKQLSAIAGVVPSKAVLPIVQNIHFRLEGNTLALSATDLDVSMQTSLRVEPTDGLPLNLALPAKLLQDTLKALPEQPVTFQSQENSMTVRLKTDNGEYELTGANGDDFPQPPAPADTQAIEMPLPVLCKAISKTLFAASTDELKPALNGMFFDFKSTGATFVATDAHRLVRYRRVDVATPQEVSFILPQKALKLLSSAAGSREDAVRIEYNSSNAFFSFGDTRLVCRLIDARFPPYENVIPAQSPNRLVLNKKELLGSLKRLDIYATKTTHLGRFRLSGNLLEVQSEDLDNTSRAKENLHCLYDGGQLEIGFNVSLMTDIIGAVETDDVVMELDNPGRAAVVLPNGQEQGENVLMLLMPVMLNASY